MTIVKGIERDRSNRDSLKQDTSQQWMRQTDQLKHLIRSDRRMKNIWQTIWY